jgi:hypothetical protein
MKKTIGKTAAEVGAGLVAASAAAAGYYLYGSKSAKQHRASAVKWANDIKKDIQEETKRLKKVGARATKKAVKRAVNSGSWGWRPKALKNPRYDAVADKEGYEEINIRRMSTPNNGSILFRKRIARRLPRPSEEYDTDAADKRVELAGD